MRDAWPPGKVVTLSERDTSKLAEDFGQTLQSPCVVLLYGDLGAGKTTFVRGLAVGLGVAEPEQVRSPSFTLVNIYRGRLPVYHVDLYRLDSRRDLESIGIDEILSEEAVVVVEWADKLQHRSGKGWAVRFTDIGGDSREIEFRRL
ncbi:MAG: tRNA (adenosine(37)-N6)-threonylcarbamoyltransferase complex ATPase subunit type 1 TsaE [Acidobacteria bacterium]|nr:tRNA (adenosine(37)-N6)-threonylcarbamoyltransferase complex ATPase subunit type 1 TsaE [Acidobacteriota bacterium]